MDARWFISYRLDIQLSILQKERVIDYGMVITDITPARWVERHTVNHHVQYAEKISIALASELIHCGAGVPAEYFCMEEGGV